MVRTPLAAHPQAVTTVEGTVHATMIQDTTMADCLAQDMIQRLLLGRVMIADPTRGMIRGTKLDLLHLRTMDMDGVDHHLDRMGDRL